MEDGHDLPELAETMEEADARAAASTYLFAMRNVKRDLDANDAEFTVLQDFNRGRHVARQKVLISQIDYLCCFVQKLFGFMRPTGKKKSLNLIGGRVGMRSQTDELVVEDDEAVITWAETCGIDGIVRLKKTVDRKALRAYMDTYQSDPNDAEPPPCRLEKRDDQFYAAPAKD